MSATTVTGNAFGIEILQTDAAQLERDVASANDGDGIRIGFDATVCTSTATAPTPTPTTAW